MTAHTQLWVYNSENCFVGFFYQFTCRVKRTKGLNDKPEFWDRLVHNICYQEYFTISFKLFLDLLSSARSRRIQKRNVDVTIFHLSEISSWLLFKLSIFLRLNACKSTVNIASKMFFKNSHTWNSHISPSSSFSVVRICGRETFRFEFVM